MFSALAFVPTFMQTSSGSSAAESGLLMLPMMAGLMGTSIWVICVQLFVFGASLGLICRPDPQRT